MKIKKWDWLLIISLVLAPMTELRIWKIGPAELLIFIWSIKHISLFMKSNIKNHMLSFWIAFLSIIVVSSIYGEIFFSQQTSPIGILTYLFFAYISSVIFLVFIENDNLYIKKVLINSMFLYLFVYGGFFLISLTGSQSVFGINLWYGTYRFSPGAHNPHQIAMPLLAMSFVALMFFIRSNGFLKKTLYLVVTVALWLVGNQTNSDTYHFATVFSILGLLLLFVVYMNRSKKEKIVVSLLLIGGVTALMLIFLNPITRYFMDWIYSDPNGPGRIRIFMSIFDTLSKNPLIGLGPGVHALNGAIEYHNTYLEIIAMSGLLGFILFVIFTIKSVKLIKYDYVLILLLLPLYSYGFAGFAFRRLVYWIIFTLVISLQKAEKVTQLRKEIRHG